MYARDDRPHDQSGARSTRSGPRSATHSVLRLQGLAGNRATTLAVASHPARYSSIGTEVLIQRWEDLGGGLVGFRPDERPKPNRFKGRLEGDDIHEYERQAAKDAEHNDLEVWSRKVRLGAPVLAAVDPAAEKLRKELLAEKTAQANLFDKAFGGDQKGTIAYVANYLYAEVPNKQEIWDEVWNVEVVNDAVKRTLKPFETFKFLERLIALGLDTTWRSVGPKRAGLITIRRKGLPSLGVGFHTTLGSPGVVLTSAKKQAPDGAQGWGGIKQTMTVPTFRRDYALDQPWNPLGEYLRRNGPAFRVGNKDNELLSTVSVATQTHATVRFPLWNSARPGSEVEHNVDNKTERTFKMEVYLYAVEVSEAFPTSARQGGNAFAEVATASIPSNQVIGHSRLTRYHQGDGPATKANGWPEQYSTADFWYELTPLTRNPAYRGRGLGDQVFAVAAKAVDAEIAAAKAKHTSG